MPITNSQEKFTHELGDTYDAEHQFLQGMEKMAQQARNEQLKSGIQQHIQQSRQQAQRLEQVFSALGQEPQRVMCHGAQGLVSEAEQTMSEAEKPELRDCIIAASALKNEHYEIVSYRALVGAAQLMGQQEAADLLRQNLQEEEQTAQTLEQLLPQLERTALEAEGKQPAAV